MDDQDLVARQREALAAFRQAGQERQAGERDAARSLKEKEKEASDLHDVVRAQLEVGRSSLSRIKRRDLLDAAAGRLSPPDGGQDPFETLVSEGGRARSAVVDVEDSVKELEAYGRAVPAAQRASQHAQSAVAYAAEAEASSERAAAAWQSVQRVLRSWAAVALCNQAQAANDRAGEASRQAREQAMLAEQAAAQAQEAVSSSGRAAEADREASLQEKRAKTAADKAAGLSRDALQAAQSAEQAASEALAAAGRARVRLRVLGAVTAVLVLALAVLLLYLWVLPFPHYRAAQKALENGEWQKAQSRLRPIALRWMPYQDSPSLLARAYLGSVRSAIEAEDWAAAAEAVFGLNQVEYNHGNTMGLGGHRPVAERLAELYAEAWQGGKAKQVGSLLVSRDLPLALSPDGQWIAVPAGAGIELRRVGSGAVERSLAGYSGVFSSLVFSLDGRTLASSSTGGSVRVFEVATGEALMFLRYHQSPSYLALSPDGWSLGVATSGAVEMYTRSQGSVWMHRNVVAKELAFSSDGNLLMAVTDGAVYWWNVADGRTVHHVERTHLTMQALPAGGRQLVATVQGSDLLIWEPDTDWSRYPLGVPSSAHLAVVDPGGQRVAVAAGNSVAIWESRGVHWGPLANQPSPFESRVTALAFSPGGTVLAVGSSVGHGVGVVTVWQAEHGTRLAGLSPPGQGFVSALEFVGPGGAVLAATKADGTVSFWLPQAGPPKP